MKVNLIFNGELNMKIKDLSLPVNTVVGYCDKCGGLLQIKEGMFGTFIGCSNFRNGCRNTVKLSKHEVDEMEYKMLETISNIRMNKRDEVLKIYESEEYNLFSDELKSKVEEYLL